MTFPSATPAARVPLLPRPAAYRPLTGVWRATDWYAQETMHAAHVREARSMVTDRWDGPGAVRLKDQVALLGKGNLEPVALRLAAISVNCGWPAVVSDGGSAAVGVPEAFASLWAAVAQRMGTAAFGAAPLLAVVNHTATASAGPGAEPALTWSATDAPSRTDLLLSTAARIDAVNASVLLKSHLLEYAEARPLTAMRGLDRIVRVQGLVHAVLASRLAAMVDAGCPPTGITAAATLAAEPPAAVHGVPPRLVTPAQQAVEALLGTRHLDSGLEARPRARRHLGREQAHAVAALDRIGTEVRALALSHKKVGAVYDQAVAAVRHSNTLYRRLIDEAAQPPVLWGKAGRPGPPPL